MLKHRQIEAFRAIIIGGSMSTAAGIMGITQPAISRLIRDLEHETRLNLFERTGGRLIATGDAMALYREVDRSFQGLERILDLARDLRERRGGSLRVAALPGLANGFLPSFAARFLGSRPNLNMSLHGMNSHFVLDWVNSGQCDLGIVENTQMPGVKVEDLPPCEMVAVLPVNHRLAERDYLTPEDFDSEDFISLIKPSVMHVMVDSIMRDRGIIRRIKAETPLSMIACGMVSAGFGISIVDPFTADRYSSSLVIRPLQPAISINWSIILPTHIKASTITNEFVTEFKAAFGEFLNDFKPSKPGS
ncbi:LysR substrate-binding domain-containing protein [Pseudomonas sp. X4]|uniref:LysR substrate-binding domain-containing protein n=1 Tax=Pseudomonas sp. X4 TaxID=3231526 RepID=UPI003460C4BC